MNQRLGMVVDLNACVGCQTCTIACKHANDTTPGVQWRRVLDVESGQYPDVERLFLVVGCQHCADPPCVPVCPTGATFQRADGLVGMAYDLCIGCGYCAVACPYQARTIVHDQQWYFGEETVQERAVEHPEREGVAQKCTFCVERIDEAKELGADPGVDLDFMPACAASCIAQAIHFGDFNDPASHVSRLARERSGFQMHRELGTDPQIKYLYDTPAVPGREDAEDENEERLRDPGNPLVGERQTFWDWRAATNFTLGSFGSGLAIIASLAHAAGGVDAWELTWWYAWSGLIMALGLFAVFLEIARKRRFLYAVLRPQSSWMTRELYCVAVFYPAIVTDFFLPHPVLHAIAALAAAAFLYCQARILQAAKGIPAWRVPLMPSMLLASGLLEGAGVFCALSAVFAPTLFAAPVPVGVAYGTPLVPGVGLLLAAINAVLWHRYRASAKARGIPPLARDVIGRVTPWVHLVGHAAPATLFAVVLAWPEGPVVLLALAGLSALAGGATWKVAVITRAAYQQGFALEVWPQRGSGVRAAPRRIH